MPVALAVAAGALVVGTGYNIVQQEKAASQNRRAQRAQRAIEDRRQARERVAQVRQAQLASAQVQVGSESGGVASSSGESGALAAIQSTTAANVNFTSQVDDLNKVRASALAKADRYQQLGAYGQQIGQTVASVASMYGSGAGGAPASSK